MYYFIANNCLLLFKHTNNLYEIFFKQCFYNYSEFIKFILFISILFFFLNYSLET